MRASLSGMILSGLLSAAHAQPLDLRGRILSVGGSPISDAQVILENRGVSASTGADGTFSLDGNAAVGPGGARPIRYRLDPDFLVVDVPSPQNMRMEVIDAEGKTAGGFSTRLETGNHRIALAAAMRDPGMAAGLYFLRLRIGGRIHAHPFVHPGKGATGWVIAPAYTARAVAKRAAAVDTLRIRKAGYLDRAVPVTSYTAGGLGDLVLSESGEQGAICARQTPHRTIDGFDVVHCEALFDQAPRVRLPAPGASRVYAAMTAEAFVTASGLSYPHANSNSSDPELRRHASALYEVEIQDGKPASYRPAVLFADSLFLAPLMGKAFEGLISKRTGAGRYELIPTLPVRVRILAERFEGDPDGASEFQAKAVIENLAVSIAAADGTCMQALSGYGSQAPFDAGKDVLIPVGRVPSMHTFGDDKIVFTLYVDGAWSGNLMSSAWFFTPLDLLRNALAPEGTYTGIGHGSPGTIPMLTLGPASGGGGSCPQ